MPTEPRTKSSEAAAAAAKAERAARARQAAEAARAARTAKAAKSAERVRVADKHDGLVRASHWAHVPLLFGLILTGLAIYWAAPVFRHAPTPGNPRGDYFVDIGRALAALFGQTPGEMPYWF